MDEFGNWQGLDEFGNEFNPNNGDGVNDCFSCGVGLSEDESGLCLDCENMGPDCGDEPDVDEMTEWHDFDPDC
jgi:hypothetical protein